MQPYFVVYECLYVHVFVVYMYIYVYRYIQMIPIKRTTYFHSLKYLKRKKSIFKKALPLSFLEKIMYNSNYSNIRK